MGKVKLTLYLDEEIVNLAKKVSHYAEKSISALVQKYFINEGKKIKELDIDQDIKAWIGILDLKEDYKQLRDNLIEDRIKKYEDIS